MVFLTTVIEELGVDFCTFDTVSNLEEIESSKESNIPIKSLSELYTMPWIVL